VRAERLDPEPFVRLGFRLRPEPWNAVETSFGVRCPKLVFAPPAGERRANVHVRPFDGPNARFALIAAALDFKFP
jgi:hypothetical protein